MSQMIRPFDEEGRRTDMEESTCRRYMTITGLRADDQIGRKKVCERENSFMYLDL